ncbi:MAG TPA: pyridoxamine 5'-phosphate oxidase family protein, partial [Verrucomicrobiae bacterium]|nr:pyridoxamine 5'-phosphate oxidase family protein [Verrucomicrobiae bacterium]
MTALTSEVSEFITRARVGRLATADATGQPLVLPICYAFDGRVLYSAVDAKPKRRVADDLTRVRNIRENAKVSLVIDEYDEDWSRLRWVILQGLADVVTTGEDFA